MFKKNIAIKNVSPVTKVKGSAFLMNFLSPNLKELSNSTSSLTTALKAISSQNKLLVKEITEQKENITFP